MTASDLSGSFRFISVPSPYTHYTSEHARTPSQKVLRGLSGRLWYLHNYRDIQRSLAARALLSGRYYRPFTDHSYDRRHRVGADRAMYLAADAVLDKCFHRHALSTHRTLKLRRGCANLQEFSNGGPGLPAQAPKAASYVTMAL